MGKSFWISFIIGGLIWAAVLFWWFVYQPPFAISERGPGMDGEPAGEAAVSRASTDIGTIFESFDGVLPSTSIKTSWPHFRGINSDNISAERVPLRDFSDGKMPDIVWTIELGEGHAAPAVHNGRVYVLDYDEKEEADMLRCFSLDSGKEMWRRGYKVKVKRNHGMSRTIPAVNDSAVITVGPHCHAMGTHAVTGELLWGIDMVSQYGSEIPLWYTGQCPFIDDTVAVLAPAGAKLLLTGVNAMTGEVVWETPNRHGWKMSHSSVIPMTFFGRRVYVYCASGGIAGVAADGEDRGSILFESDEFNQAVVAPSPVQIGGDRIFMTAGYSAGAAVFQVSFSGGKFSISMTGRHTVRESLASEQQTPLYSDGHLYAVLPKDAGAHRDQFVCVDGRDVTAVKWTSGHDFRFGLGPFIIADNKFFILSDDGLLTAAAISARRFERLGTAKISSGVDAWGPMALVSGRLLLRDSRRMFCVDLRK
ncbi:MAG: PQQ-binding-like beta-propeller repeat protein [Chitinispirillia bacterium]|nr:PQQ-binding-like beta-propeller repeat protein [Chitinispirillia bacterium]MCL2269112.1 PQQ-binding-like beta-propeller repeat protein [Chitinispirillia bacterium]